ncbi:Putative Zinc finger, PHD-type, Zinc finger, FYVE/PHD-type, Zinc finger, RING/FYVE/PHD-type [Colletotrichum destructivum]|uniref:Zinc finger, PHD-type, Zinc finger, FYVE/PHD-type, Zinc finger, RING/FYVE/PHD-type n=1 Tax=Colletotrichum destructivum TaxID=34406 RepID=A0AAX4I2C2_9PEZI|nr:Putative Zinc finger, PHD-type, Zinc finger, FYVE/PHD-type, Zinc finger, RING/FYVE/PHD-type [Colletotrichum destructivum]
MSYGLDLTMFGPLAPEATATDQDAMNENMLVNNETEAQGEGIPPTSTHFTAQYAQMDAVGPSQPSLTPAEAAPAGVQPASLEREEPRSPTSAPTSAPSSAPTSAPSSAPTSATTSAPSSYKRQFSPATSRYILSRLHHGSDRKLSSSAPNARKDEPPAPSKTSDERALHCPVDLSTLPQTLHLPDTTHTASSIIALSQPPSAGAKRKRAVGDEGARMSSNLPAYSEPEILRRPMPRPPLKRKRAKGDGNGHPMCTNCKRTSYTSANRIVLCSCGEAWHQLCHNPEISDEVAADLRRFQCRTCEVEEKEHAKYQRQLALYREAKQEQAEWKKQHNDIERRREKRLATLPKFPKAEIVGFEAGNASPAERREYFGDLMQSDLVNLLIFSNELQPGLLADVLVSISKKHPELPIFGSPNWAQPKVPQQEAQRPRQNNPARPKASKQRSKTGGVRKILKTAPAEAADPAANEADDDDALPESWPKAGHGLYAKLKPEKEDPFLFDDNDEEAFSHFMVDPRGKQIMEPLVG